VTRTLADRRPTVTPSRLQQPAAGPEQGYLPQPTRSQLWRRVMSTFLDRDTQRSYWAVLRHEKVRRYFIGSLASNLGTWLQNTAQVLLAYQFTHSVFGVGLVTCAQFAGSLFLAPWAAALADRVGGRRVLISTQLFSAAIAGVMCFLQFTGRLSESLLICGALGLGLAFTFALPIQVAMIPTLLSPERVATPRPLQRDTEAAMGMNSVSYNAGRALAPALCILVIATMGFAPVFALNSISFIFFAVVLLRIHPQSAGQSNRGVQVRKGIKVAFRQPRILLLLLMVGAVTIADDPVLVLGPGLAQNVLGTSNDWAGYFLAALGCGTVLGSLFVPNMNGMFRKKRTGKEVSNTSSMSKRAAWSLLFLSLSVLIFVIGFSRWMSLLAALAAGVAALVTSASTQALLVQLQPANRSSVMALWAIAWAGTKPLASLLDGWLATNLGLRLAGLILIAPAVGLALTEICLRKASREWLRKTGRDFCQSKFSDASVHP
jgi:MFS family permease